MTFDDVGLVGGTNGKAEPVTACKSLKITGQWWPGCGMKTFSPAEGYFGCASVDKAVFTEVICAF